MKRKILAGLCLVAALMAGCASVPKRIEGVTQGVDIGALQRWDVTGRIGVAAAQGGGSGSFNWQQRGTESSVQLHGPVGVGSLQLQVNGDEIEVRAANGETYRADAAVNELQARLGAVIPLGKLRYWLTGQAAPGDYRWLDDRHSVLEQDGWRIEYSEYLVQDNLRLPARIVASNGTARVRILIEHWRVG